MGSYIPKSDDIKKEWYVVDVKDKVLGRVASEVSKRLMGKHKPMYTPHLDVGDFIVIINADKVNLTGRKLNDKVYYHHSGYPGGLKSINAEKLIQQNPEKLFTLAVRGMLPKNKLGRKMIKKLKVYSGSEHPHQAQEPVILEI